jgi:hypothetical protein
LTLTQDNNNKFAIKPDIFGKAFCAMLGLAEVLRSPLDAPGVVSYRFNDKLGGKSLGQIETLSNMVMITRASGKSPSSATVAAPLSGSPTVMWKCFRRKKPKACAGHRNTLCAVKRGTIDFMNPSRKWRRRSGFFIRAGTREAAFFCGRTARYNLFRRKRCVAKLPESASGADAGLLKWGTSLVVGFGALGGLLVLREKRGWGFVLFLLSCLRASLVSGREKRR